MSRETNNIAVNSVKRLLSVNEARAITPMSEKARETIAKGRDYFIDVLNERDKRPVVIVGPCSIHDESVALDYAERLNKLALKHRESLLILMRVYFEKPRTSTGWKGLISDPHLDDTNDIASGLTLARSLLCKIAEMGVFPATEFLDPIIPAYLGELVSWVAIGARTTESQTHRQMASGLSAPVGFKNSTDGSVGIALNAILAAKKSHHILGVDDNGYVSIIETRGNDSSHIILRGAAVGGGWKANHHGEDVAAVEAALDKLKLRKRLMVDCSHANCAYDYRKQSLVARDIIAQKRIGNRSIFGLMFESNIHEGKQDCIDPKQLKYGVSITDGCIGWDETEEIINLLASEPA